MLIMLVMTQCCYTETMYQARNKIQAIIQSELINEHLILELTPRNLI